MWQLALRDVPAACAQQCWAFPTLGRGSLQHPATCHSHQGTDVNLPLGFYDLISVAF